MSSKKKKIIVTVILCIAIISTAVIVSAYFTDYVLKDNTITPAENVIEISEDYEPPVEQEAGDNIYKKEIKFVNKGNAPCYVRVYMDFSESEVRSRSYLSNDPDQSPESFFSAERVMNGSTYISKLSTVAPGWVFVPDESTSVMAGYYYYVKPVPVGESTTPLMTYVKTINETENDIKQYDIMVYSESIQLSDDDGRVFTDYADAWESTVEQQ